MASSLGVNCHLTRPVTLIHKYEIKTCLLNPLIILYLLINLPIYILHIFLCIKKEAIYVIVNFRQRLDYLQHRTAGMQILWQKMVYRSGKQVSVLNDNIGTQVRYLRNNLRAVDLFFQNMIKGRRLG